MFSWSGEAWPALEEEYIMLKRQNFTINVCVVKVFKMNDIFCYCFVVVILSQGWLLFWGQWGKPSRVLLFSLLCLFVVAPATGRKFVVYKTTHIATKKVGRSVGCPGELFVVLKGWLVGSLLLGFGFLSSCCLPHRQNKECNHTHILHSLLTFFIVKKCAV